MFIDISVLYTYLHFSMITPNTIGNAGVVLLTSEKARTTSPRSASTIYSYIVNIFLKHVSD